MNSELTISNPFIIQVLDNYLESTGESNITGYVQYLADAWGVSHQDVLNFLTQEYPKIDQNLFNSIVYPLVHSPEGVVNNELLEEFLNVASDHTDPLYPEGEAPNSTSPETTEEVKEEEEIEELVPSTPVLQGTFSNRGNMADFQKKIEYLEEQLRQRDRTAAIKERLHNLRQTASKLVDDMILPPAAFKVLMGEFATDSDMYATFSRVSQQNKCTEEEHLERIEYTLAVFKACGGTLDFNQHLEDEESRRYQDDRLLHLEQAPLNLSAMGINFKPLPNKG